MSSSHESPGHDVEPASTERRVGFPGVLWAWVGPAWRAAAAQLASEPDAEEGYRGHRVEHERPHLVPLGYILLWTPLLLFIKLIEWTFDMTYAVPFFTAWIPFTLMGSLWSLGLYVSHRRAAKASSDRDADEVPRSD